MIENPSATTLDIAYWFCRVVEPHISDDVKHAHTGRYFETTINPSLVDRASNEKKGTAASGESVWHELRNGPVVKFGNERFTANENHILRGESEDIFEFLLTGSNASSYVSYEAVPRFRKRPSDVVLEGSNNTLIVLGTDRSGSISLSEWSSNAGSIDIVAGRGQTQNTLGVQTTTTSIKDAKGETKGSTIKEELNKSFDVLSTDEGDLDASNDRSRILISQKTGVDARFKLKNYNSDVSVVDSPKGDASIAIKSDKIRLIARSDLELIVTNFDLSTSPLRDDRKDEKNDLKTWASITIKTNGDIVFRPSSEGYIKLGDDTADRALLCTDTPASLAAGKVLPTTSALTNTMGGKFGGTQIPSQGTWAKKVLVTGANAVDPPTKTRET
jgi:hypothetical protein